MLREMIVQEIIEMIKFSKAFEKNPLLEIAESLASAGGTLVPESEKLGEIAPDVIRVRMFTPYKGENHALKFVWEVRDVKISAIMKEMIKVAAKFAEDPDRQKMNYMQQPSIIQEDITSIMNLVSNGAERFSDETTTTPSTAFPYRKEYGDLQKKMEKPREVASRVENLFFVGDRFGILISKESASLPSEHILNELTTIAEECGLDIKDIPGLCPEPEI
jgi:hypothetical protein